MQAPYNPPVNIAPKNPDFLVSGNCTGSTGAYTCANPASALTDLPDLSSNPACTAYALAAINNARAQENVAPMVLPPIGTA